MAGGTSMISRIRGSSVQLQALAFIAFELWKNASRRVEQNLTPGERSDFLDLIRRSRAGARRGNLSDREQRRLSHLTKKAATGQGDADWGDVLKALPTLVPPRAIAQGVGRFRGPRH
jgi:hypothetical protein